VRTRLLEGMLAAAGEEGFEEASVRSVLERTGIYRQAFYNNFADKGECFAAAWEFGAERLGTRLAARAEEGADRRDRLMLALRQLLVFLEKDPVSARALIVEVHKAGPAALRRRAGAVRTIAEWIATTGDDGEALSLPSITSEGIVAGIHAVLYPKLAQGSTESFTDLLPDLMFFAISQMEGPEVAATFSRSPRSSS
jgi:AcrR family transcriptional regulator